MHERMTDKTRQPTDIEMENTISEPIAGSWQELRTFLEETYMITPVFNPGGKKYGWNLQHRLGGRPLCEMYPEYGSNTALVILGKAELEQALGELDTFEATVRRALEESPRYDDGCWTYIRVADPLTCRQDAADIERLILIKRKPVKN